MFTGIIQDTGKVKRIQAGKLQIETSFDDLQTGESISVNGVCLTVEKIEKLFTPLDSKHLTGFTVSVSRETFSRTNLGKLKAGKKVNLERALRVSDRVGGHFVSGHIEGTGRIISVIKRKGEWIFRFRVSPHLQKFLIPKGSIAIDGISLTICEVSGITFTVSVIPHTFQNTILKERKTGNVVNIEPDMLMKGAVDKLTRLPSGR